MVHKNARPTYSISLVKQDQQTNTRVLKQEITLATRWQYTAQTDHRGEGGEEERREGGQGYNPLRRRYSAYDATSTDSDRADRQNITFTSSQRQTAQDTGTNRTFLLLKRIQNVLARVRLPSSLLPPSLPPCMSVLLNMDIHTYHTIPQRLWVCR